MRLIIKPKKEYAFHVPRDLKPKELASLMDVDVCKMYLWRSGKRKPCQQIKRHFELVKWFKREFGTYPTNKPPLNLDFTSWIKLTHLADVLGMRFYSVFRWSKDKKVSNQQIACHIMLIKSFLDAKGFLPRYYE